MASGNISQNLGTNESFDTLRLRGGDRGSKNVLAGRRILIRTLQGARKRKFTRETKRFLLGVKRERVKIDMVKDWGGYHIFLKYNSPELSSELKRV